MCREWYDRTVTLSLFDSNALPTTPPPLGGFQPRPYQVAARDAVRDHHRRHRSTLVVKATGLGKTALSGMLATDAKDAGGKTLFLAPTIKLVEQTYNALRLMGLSVGSEQAENHVCRPLPDVTVASVATLRGDRLRTFPRDSYALIVVDESHRAPGGSLYTEILEWFATAKVVGLTATPSRADGLAMANVFESVCFEYPILPAIKDGWLSPLRFQTVETDWDPKRLKEIAGEVDPGSVARELVRSGALHDAAASLAELSAERKSVSFLPTVNVSKAFCAQLLERNIPCAHIDGSTPPAMRDAIYRDFRRGHIRALVNCGVLVEGFDEPEVSIIALLSPTKSWGRLCQQIGRGTRLFPGKDHCLVLDFCPGRLRKGRLASPADALAGRMLDDKVYEHLPESGDLSEAIEVAEKTAEEVAQRKARQEAAAKARAEKIAALKAEARRRKYSYGTVEHNASALFGAGDDSGARQSATRDGPAEDEDARRSRLGLPSVKQARILASKGMRPDMPRKLAGEAMGMLSANGWQVTERMRNDKRFWQQAEVKT